MIYCRAFKLDKSISIIESNKSFKLITGIAETCKININMVNESFKLNFYPKEFKLFTLPGKVIKAQLSFQVKSYPPVFTRANLSSNSHN